MLIDRIKKSKNGFHITKEKGSPSGRQVFFGTYTFKNDADFVPDLRQCEYWKPMDSDIQIDKPETLIYVVEKTGEKIDNEARFYWSNSTEKPNLVINTSPADKKYGEQAYEINIVWRNNGGESINNDYFYLKSIEGDEYHFLRPMVGGPGIDEESYIYIVPDGDNPRNYSVKVHSLLEDKYNITFEG